MDFQKGKSHCLFTNVWLYVCIPQSPHQLSLLDLMVVLEVSRMGGNHLFLQQRVNIFLAIF